jgi:hypothetical protein
VTPDCPTSYHNDLSENTGIKLPSTPNQHFLRIQACVPVNVYKSPAPLTKRTLKELRDVADFPLNVCYIAHSYNPGDPCFSFLEVL